MSERFEQAAIQRFHQREAERGVPEGVQAGGFVAGTQEGDPEKRDYLHSHGRSLKRNIMVQGFRTDDRQCPGCMFPDAPEGKWPHVNDLRCLKVRRDMWTLEGNAGIERTMAELQIDKSTLPGALFRLEGQIP